MRRQLAILAAAALCAVVRPVVAQEQPERRPMLVPTLSVTGEGQVSVEPDLAVVRLGFSSQKPEAAAVQAEVNAAMQKVLAAVKEIVPGENVQTSMLNLYPVYSDRRPVRGDEAETPEPRIVGYRADQTVSVRVTDLTKVGEVIDAGLSAGANRLDGISFELQNDTQAKSQALQQAVRAAQEKARAMAAAMEVELVGLVEAAEAGAEVFRPMYDTAGAELLMSRRMSPSTPVEPGQIQVHANLTLRYRIGGPGVAAGGAPRGLNRERDREDDQGRQPISQPRPSQPR